MFEARLDQGVLLKKLLEVGSISVFVTHGIISMHSDTDIVWIPLAVHIRC